MNCKLVIVSIEGYEQRFAMMVNPDNLSALLRLQSVLSTYQDILPQLAIEEDKNV